MSVRCPRRAARGGVRGGGESGFTLVELVVVVTIASVVLGFAALTFTGFFQRNAARRAASLFAQDLSAARAYAIRSREPVVIRFFETSMWYQVSTVSTATEVTRRRFGTNADIDLTAISLDTQGDSIVFSARGIADFVPQSGTLGTANFSSGATTYSVSFNGMGASKIEQS